MFDSIKNSVIRFLKDEEGASGIEYAIIAAMVAVVIVGFVTPIGDLIVEKFQAIQDGLTEAPADPG